MGAPQIIYIVLVAISWTVHSMKHGQPRDGYNVGWATVNTAVAVGLLYWGGFFS